MKPSIVNKCSCALPNALSDITISAISALPYLMRRAASIMLRAKFVD